MEVTSLLDLSSEPYYLTVVIFLPLIIPNFSHQGKGGEKLPHLEGGYCITLQGGQGSQIRVINSIWKLGTDFFTLQ